MPETVLHDPLSGDFTGLPRRGEILDGKYRIQGVIGKGGMAYVLSATHVHLDERVAIKVLRPEYADDAELVDRFMREGRAAIRIRSEHVVRVLDVGIVAKRPYMVMEYLEGRDLETILADEGRLSVERTVDYVLQACEAIAEAHVAGIVHRDLKPANLFLVRRADQSESVKVLDFGISKVMKGPSDASGLRACGTRPSAFMGSPHYMSPEQMRSASEVDARTDLWSLGAILHELLTGHPPFVADSIPALCLQVLSEPPTPLRQLRADVPVALEVAVQRCLAVKAADRFANVAELAGAIASCGSPAARSSADCIQRIIASNRFSASSPPPSPELTPVRSERSRSRVISASEILEEREPSVPMNHPRLGYFFAALMTLAAGAGSAYALKHTYPDLLSRVRWQTPVSIVETTEGLVPVPPVAVAPSAPVPLAAPSATVSSTIASPAPNTSEAPAPPRKSDVRPRHVWHHHAPSAPLARAPGDDALPSDQLPLTPPEEDNPYSAPPAAAAPATN